MTIQIKIDGKEIEAQEGQTILQVAQQHGIEIPVLCNHEALLPFGGCRMCLVEAGPGALKAACTTPVTDKMDVKTRSAEIDNARMTILQLLFGERNHYCMYCESTGNCELQDLGYQLGLDHFEFAPFQRNFPQDTSHPYFLLDHARCVLCGRCVRACSHLAGHMTLGVRDRGTESQVEIDLGVPLGSSTCTSCGLCVQVCPTGALTDKRSAYLGRREKDIEVFSSACDRCPVGCGLDIYKRSNFILKIWGNWQAEPSKGVLCKKGRYQPLYETRTRLTAPWRKEGGQWKELATDEALENIAQRLDGAAVVVEGSLGNEALAAWKKLGLPLYAADDVQPPLASTATLASLTRADAVVVLGLDLNQEYPVVGSLIKRRAWCGAARLILVDSGFNSLDAVAQSVYHWKDLDTALGEARGFHNVVVVYSRLTPATTETLKRESRFQLLFLPYETNTYGLQALGIQPGRPQTETVLVLGENLQQLRQRFPQAFLVALTPYRTPAVEEADLLIPIPGPFETTDSFININGLPVERNRVLTPPAAAVDPVALARALAAKAGKPL